MTREEAIELNKNLMMYMRISDKTSEYKFLTENYTALEMAIKALDKDPKPVDYYDCSSAMLKLWMENIVTDSEYYRIIDKLNAKHKEGKI